MPDSYAGTKICGVEATLAIGEEIQRFVSREIVYVIQGTLPGIAPTSLSLAFAELSRHISTKCGAKFFSTDQKPGVQPNIVVSFGQIDGSGKVLAWSQLRQSESWQVQQKHDDAELWTIASNPPANKISWPLVALHETIHSLGCPHLSGGVAVMNPIYNPALSSLQPLDIAWLVSSYGEPTTTGELPPPIGETLLGNLYIDGNGFLKVRRV
jgi:hypothetical protein